MGTYHWGNVAVGLVKKGWKYAPEAETDPEDMVYGDPDLIDPATGLIVSIEEAQRIQENRESSFGNT